MMRWLASVATIFPDSNFAIALTLVTTAVTVAVVKRAPTIADMTKLAEKINLFSLNTKYSRSEFVSSVKSLLFAEHLSIIVLASGLSPTSQT